MVVREYSAGEYSGAACRAGASLADFDCQRMHALAHQRAQRIIHKAVASHARFASESRSRNAHAKVRAVPQAVGASVPDVLLAFVKHLQLGWLQRRLQSRLQLRGGYGMRSGFPGGG